MGWCCGCLYGPLRSSKLAQYDDEKNVLSVFSHNPTEETFRSLVKWLRRERFSFVSTDDLLDGNLPRGRKAWLTFDDGWVSCKNVVLPIAGKEDVPFTIFVSPQETRRGKIWNAYMDDEQKKKLYTLDDDARYAAVDAFLATQPTRKDHLLSEADIRELGTHPLVTIENHTYTHPSCVHRPLESILESVERATETIMEWTGRRPRMMCYPFGHRSEATDRAITNMGYVPVCSRPGVMTMDTIGKFRNLFYDDMTFLENSCRVLGAWKKITEQDDGKC